jgi:hypothetical protein
VIDLRISAPPGLALTSRCHVTVGSGLGLIALVNIIAAMAVARLPLLVIDCPDPGALARFYGAMLD